MVNIILAYITVSIGILSVTISIQSYRKSVQVDQSNIKPLIQVKPVEITTSSRSKDVKIFLKILNYSEYDAYNFFIDLKFGGHNWKKESFSAAGYDNAIQLKKAIKAGHVSAKYQNTNEELPFDTQFEIVNEYLYKGDIPTISKLESGGSISVTIGDSYLNYKRPQISLFFSKLPLRQGWINDLDNACKGGELKILLRAKWENSINKVFERIQEYRVICTKSGEGKSYTFIPYGVVIDE